MYTLSDKLRNCIIDDLEKNMKGNAKARNLIFTKSSTK